ncbi:MAG TPA: channel protein TolC, partial [Burkholderiales bacterium]|nr:channel protein TolC [Burkholderiales bacterium]
MKRIAFLVAALFADQSEATDLITIYREAQVQDATYAGAKAQYIGAQEKLPQARALLLPNVAFGA